MKRKNFFTGSVFQFYVPEIRKFAFCKFFDFTNIIKFNGLIVQVFNRFSEIEDNHIDDLKYCDWLFGPRTVHKWPDLKKLSKWKSLGVLASSSDDSIPDFKGVRAFPYIVENESAIGPWYPIYDLVKGGENCEYDQVKHLEQLILTPTIGIEIRTGMEYCRLNGIHVQDYYDLKEPGKRRTYWQMINIPFYRDIPREIRGKALAKR